MQYTIKLEIYTCVSRKKGPSTVLFEVPHDLHVT